VPRRVHVRPVVERVGVGGGLHAPVTVGARIGHGGAAAKQRQRPFELVALRGVDQVAGHEHALRLAPVVYRGDGRGEQLCRERLLGPKRAPQARPKPVEERDPRGRLRIPHVYVAYLREACQHALRPPAAPELGPVAKGHCRPAREHPVAVVVDERAGERGAGPRIGPAAGERPCQGAAQQRERFTARAAVRVPRAHVSTSRSPATTGSRTSRRAVQALAEAVRTTRPTATSTTWPGRVRSGRSA
jgi:hypothetical protein